MAKRQKFGISQAINQGLSETVKAVENNAGSLRFEVIALSRIEPDPENPRALIISSEDIKDTTYEKSPEKLAEYQRLQSLAETIKRKGIMNPVVVYKNGDKYRLVAGERRYLASIIAGKEDIQARILNEKPKMMDLRMLQWIENTEREDLPLKDRIANLHLIVSEHQNEVGKVDVTATLLKDLVGISLTQASSYISALNASPDIMKYVSSNTLNNLDKVAFLTKISNPEIRNTVLEACIAGYSLKQMKDLLKQEELNKKKPLNSSKNTIKKSGRAATRVNLGVTSSLNIIKMIIDTVIQKKEYKNHSRLFDKTDWTDYAETSKAFKSFIELLEKEGA